MRHSSKAKRKSIHKNQTDRQRKRRRPTAGKKHRSFARSRLQHAAPRTAKQYLAMSRQSQEIWDRVTQVPGLMRSQNLSLKRASKQVGLRSDLVARLARRAFRKRPNGRYIAKKVDHLLRPLVIPGDKGLREIFVRDSNEASLIGEYWSALDRYLVRGDASRLQKFRKRRIRPAQGKSIFLLTDLDELARQASAGVLRFESLYGRTK